MSDAHSYAEFILGVLRAQLVDCARQYPELTKEFTRDFQRLSSAIECHGIMFALDVMPTFRKHFDKCLAEERLTPSNLIHFGSWKKGWTIPRLFRGLFQRVFDCDGQLKDQPDANAIRLLRQLLGVVRKLRITAGLKDTRDSIREFYQVDMGVRRGTLDWEHHDVFDDEVDKKELSFDDDRSNPVDSTIGDLGLDHTPTPNVPLPGALRLCQQVADIVVTELGTFVPYEWSPRHGPGAVSDQSFGVNKYDFKHWPERLESQFPYADIGLTNYAMGDCESIEVARAKGFYHEPPARLCAVPKTIKTPRLIACEPTSLQWCQQIVRDYFYKRVGATVLGNFIDFRRQDLNGNLALSASRGQTHSTIDLSAASDRISCWHVERLFRRSPSLLRSLQASRSLWIEQDICRISPRYHILRKYSTMGNATTFPVQSVLFAVLAIASVLYVRGIRPSRKSIAALGRGTVRVFGDDIVIPNDCSGVLVAVLENLEMKVNTNKTFRTGKFRESCGVDAYDGNDVTTINILDLPRRAAPGSIASSVDSHNNLLSAGYFATSAFLRKMAERTGTKKVPNVKHGSGAFGWATYDPVDNSHLRKRFNDKIHVWEYLCAQPMAKCDRSPTEGHPGLLQFFTEAAKVVTSAVSTLGYLSQRPKNKLILRWASF